MKNTTFRKKALLSSVAMLLVAIVALGSATFAWFTANPVVSASGLSMQASTDAGLQILTDSHQKAGGAFGLTSIIKAEKDPETQAIATSKTPISLATPVSYCEDDTSAVTFATAVAQAEGNYAHKANSIETGASAAYSEVIYLKSSIEGDEITVNSASVKINANSGAKGLEKAVRVMLVDANGTVLGIWGTDATANDYITSAGALANSSQSKRYASKAVAPADIDVDYTGLVAVTMYVWLDGEDDECFTTNVDNTLDQLIDSIDVKFSLEDTISWT